MSKDIESNNTAKSISESELEAVAGGEQDGISGNRCRFTPEKPIQHNGGKDGWVWVKCSSSCLHCLCNGTDRCKNRWHLMEHLAGDIWVPSPIDQYKHSERKSAVMDPSIPKP